MISPVRAAALLNESLDAVEQRISGPATQQMSVIVNDAYRRLSPSTRDLRMHERPEDLLDLRGVQMQ